MRDKTREIDTNDLRLNLTRYLKDDKGTTFYITRYNELIGELKVYTEETKLKTELDIARRLINSLENKGSSLAKAV